MSNESKSLRNCTEFHHSLFFKSNIYVYRMIYMYILASFGNFAHTEKENADEIESPLLVCSIYYIHIYILKVRYTDFVSWLTVLVRPIWSIILIVIIIKKNYQYLKVDCHWLCQRMFEDCFVLSLVRKSSFNNILLYHYYFS